MQLNLSFSQFQQAFNESETLRRFVWTEMGGTKSISDFIAKVKSDFPDWQSNKIAGIKGIRTISQDKTYRDCLLLVDSNAFTGCGSYVGLVFAKNLYETKF